MNEWLTLGLGGVDRALAPAQPKALVRASRPSSVDVEDDYTKEAVPISRDHNPEAVLRYRSEGRRGDPRNLHALYREMPGRAAGPQIRRSRIAIEAAEWEFAPMPLAARDETIQSPEARVGREVAAYLTEVLRPHMRTALRLWAKKEQHGFSAAKFAVEPGAGPEGLERVNVFEEILGDRFRLDYATQDWRLFPKRNSGETVECAPFIETGSLLLFEDSPGVPLDQKGLLWQIVIPWCVYQYGLRWWSRLNERAALPYLDVAYGPTVKNGADESEKIARKLGASGISVRPKDVEVQFLSAMQQAQADSLERLQEFSLRAFSAGLLGHDQATGAREGAGAKTSDVAAQGVAQWLVAQQLGDAAFEFEAKWYGPMVRRNFGDKVASKHTPVLVLRQKEDVDREAEARIADLSVNAGAEIPEAEYLKKIGYRPARPGERVLTRRVLAAPVPPAEGKPPAKLAEVVRFPQLGEGGRPPVLGADGAPAGIAEEILAPYRRIFTDAVAEGATMSQALARVQQRARTRPEGKLVVDRLTSALFASTGHGLEEARDARGEE